MKTKKCTKCKLTLPVADFHKDKSKKTGLRERCKSCRCKHKSGSLEKKCIACGDSFKINNTNAKAQKYCGVACQKYHIRYGISEYEYEDMLISCENKCMICGEKEKAIDKRTGKKYALAIDHCHDSGKVRGILCSSCNIGIGLFNDNVDKLKNAINYLNNSNQKLPKV